MDALDGLGEDVVDSRLLTAGDQVGAIEGQGSCRGSDVADWNGVCSHCGHGLSMLGLLQGYYLQWWLSDGCTDVVVSRRRASRSASRHTGHGVGTAHPLDHVLGLSSRSIPVPWVLLHVFVSNLLRFVDERSLLGFTERLPFRTQPLAQLRVVHARVVLRKRLSSVFRPDHESVHGPFDMIRRSVRHHGHLNVCCTAVLQFYFTTGEGCCYRVQ